MCSSDLYYLPYLKVGNGLVFDDVKSFTTSALDETEFVDLGLSVLWASRNIGALETTDKGGLFGWSDLTGLNVSENGNDYYYSGNICGSERYDLCKSLGIGRLPERGEMRELVMKCSREWVENGTEAGYKFTGLNGNSIFMPAAGIRSGNDVSDQEIIGNYWSGTLNRDYYGFSMSFDGSSASMEVTECFNGLSIRAVKPQPSKIEVESIFKKWTLDLNKDGVSKIFAGPVYFYGTDDSWTTVTDKDIISGDSWSWEPDGAGNTWITEANAFGYMTFNS